MGKPSPNLSFADWIESGQGLGEDERFGISHPLILDYFGIIPPDLVSQMHLAFEVKKARAGH